jgi:hypothetical protein
MAYIESAMFGDERYKRDVTNTIQDKYQKEGKVNVDVNSSLIPMVVIPDEVVLTEGERGQIRNEAERQCGGQDTTCIEAKRAELERAKFQDKRNRLNTSANLVKGRSLEVRYVDEYGAKKTIVVPEGQRFRLGTKTLEDGYETFTRSRYYWEVLKIGGVILSTFLYVFSIAATYKTFMQGGYAVPAYVATGLAVLVPYSGYLSMLVFFAYTSYQSQKTLGS